VELQSGRINEIEDYTVDLKNEAPCYMRAVLRDAHLYDDALKRRRDGNNNSIVSNLGSLS
jgi:hypothetical protein